MTSRHRRPRSRSFGRQDVMFKFPFSDDGSVAELLDAQAKLWPRGSTPVKTYARGYHGHQVNSTAPEVKQNAVDLQQMLKRSEGQWTSSSASSGFEDSRQLFGQRDSNQGHGRPRNHHQLNQNEQLKDRVNGDKSSRPTLFRDAWTETSERSLREMGAQDRESERKALARKTQARKETNKVTHPAPFKVSKLPFGHSPNGSIPVPKPKPKPKPARTTQFNMNGNVAKREPVLLDFPPDDQPPRRARRQMKIMELVDRLCADPIISVFIEENLDDDAREYPPEERWFQAENELSNSSENFSNFKDRGNMDSTYMRAWQNAGSIQPITPTSSLASEERHERALLKEKILAELQADDEDDGDVYSISSNSASGTSM